MAWLQITLQSLLSWRIRLSGRNDVGKEKQKTEGLISDIQDKGICFPWSNFPSDKELQEIIILGTLTWLQAEGSNNKHAKP